MRLPKRRRLLWCSLGFLMACTLLSAITFRHIERRWVSSKYRRQIPFNSRAWAAADLAKAGITARQQMLLDLVTTVLPGKSRHEIVSLLGPSPNHEEMQRYATRDFSVRERRDNGTWEPFPRTGAGYYLDQFDWDMLYEIGREQILLRDHKGQFLSPDNEWLIIRLDAKGTFHSWYVEGSNYWATLCRGKGVSAFRKTR